MSSGQSGVECPVEDVDRGVGVGVRGVPAGFALEDRLALAVSGCAVPTGGARTTGVAGVHTDHCPFGHLVFKTGEEPAPHRGEDRLVERSLRAGTVRQEDPQSFGVRLRLRTTDHVHHAKVFDRDPVSYTHLTLPTILR